MRELIGLDIHSSTKIKDGLQRVIDFLALLGNPQDKLSGVIHVAGTNGKGSITAFLKAVLMSNGYKVHRYISPHLIEYNERIELYGEPIKDADLNHYIEYCQDLMTKHHLDLSFFEIFTAAAFVAFMEHPADFNIIEVGLGGRLDATNVFHQPTATIISTISRDHIKILGDTVEQIALEKAGIIRPGVPLILNEQPPSVTTIYQEIATAQQCPLWCYGRDFTMLEQDKNAVFRMQDYQLPLPKIGLRGKHQWRNCATALATLRSIITLDPLKIQQGVAETSWPGRLSPITSGALRNLLPNAEWELWMDGAHNEGGAKVLDDWLATQPGNNYVIFGILQTKEAHDFLHNLAAEHVTGICPIDFTCHTATFSHQYLSELVQQHGLPLITIPTSGNIPAEKIDYLQAIKYLVQHYPAGKIILCGSLYLMGQILTYQYDMSEVTAR